MSIHATGRIAIRKTSAYDAWVNIELVGHFGRATVVHISRVDKQKVNILFLIVLVGREAMNNARKRTDNSDLFHMSDKACKITKIAAV